MEKDVPDASEYETPEGVYSGLLDPEKNVYCTVDKATASHLGSQKTCHCYGGSLNQPGVVFVCSPYRLATVCLGLLCAVSLTIIIALCVHYNGVRDQPSSQNNSLWMTELNQLQLKYSNLRKDHDELQGEVTELNRVCKPCPRRWKLFDSKCYYFSADKLNWTDSRTACRKQGADLVIINSRNEQEFITNQTNGKSYWIGLTDMAEEGVWRWVDNRSLNETYWNDKQPDLRQKKQDCVFANPKAKGLTTWHDHHCSTNIYRICEVNAQSLHSWVCWTALRRAVFRFLNLN